MKWQKIILAGCLAGILAGLAIPGWTQELSGAGDDALVSFRRSLAGVSDPGPARLSASTNQERGIRARDTIRGNGTRAGYVLSHGGVIPNSETITVDGSTKARGRDYFINPDNPDGTIMFAEPVKKSQTISVNYRYSAAQDANRTAIGGPTLALNFGSGSKLGITYAYNPGADGSDMLTYGLNMTTKLGEKSSMQNLWYMSTPRESGRLNLQGGSKPEATEQEADQMFVNSTTLDAGKWKFGLDYQDVGKDFSGFAALRQQNAAAAEKLNQLEKEKGLKRMGFQASGDLGSGMNTGLAMRQIKDDNGAEISYQSLNLTGSKMKLAYDTRKVDKDFQRFKDIAEGNRDQLAKETGMERRNLSLGFAAGKSAGADAWNMFNRSEIIDSTGKISMESMNLLGKNISFSARKTEVEQGFGRMGSLTGEDVSNIAMSIRQQFDPNANGGGVSDPEKQHILSQTGIERSNYRLGLNAGKTAVNMQNLEIGDQTGGIERRTISLAGKDFGLNWMTQEADEGFTGITRLAPVERQYFGNERGMSRNLLSGHLNLKSGAKLAMSMSGVDMQGAGIEKQSLSFTGKKLSLTYDKQSVDANFNRITDLAAGDQVELALFAHRQFNPAAAAGNLQKEDMPRVANEAGISRENIRMNLQSGTTSTALQMLNIDQDSGSISQQSLALGGKNFSLNVLSRSIDEGTAMSRLALIERSNFGNEHGMNRLNIDSAYSSKHGLKLNARMSTVDAAGAGLSKYGLSLTGKAYSVSANFMDMDPEFTRVMDLADSERDRLNTELGMRRYDVTTRFMASKSVGIETYLYDAKHNTSDFFRKQMTNTINYRPQKGPQITLFRDEKSWGTPGADAEYLHETYSLNHRLGIVSFNMVQDMVEHIDENGNSLNIDTQVLHFDTDPAKKIALVGDMKRMRGTDGRFEDNQTLKMTARLSDSVTFAGFRTTVETKDREFESQEFGLAGKLSKNMAVNLKFGQAVENGRMLGKAHEISLTPGKARDYGMFKDVNWSLRFIETRDAQKVQNQSNGFTLGMKVLNNTVKVDYNSAVAKDKVTPITRAFSIASDPNPEKKLHYDLSYKSLDTANAGSVLFRRFNADFRLSGTTKLIYTYADHNVKSDGKIEPITTERIGLTTRLNKAMSFDADWHSKVNPLISETRVGLGIGVKGRLSERQKLEARYEVDRAIYDSYRSTARTYKLVYDHQLNEENFLSLTGALTEWTGRRLASPDTDDTSIQLDYRKLFN